MSICLRKDCFFFFWDDALRFLLSASFSFTFLYLSLFAIFHSLLRFCQLQKRLVAIFQKAGKWEIDQLWPEQLPILLAILRQ